MATPTIRPKDEPRVLVPTAGDAIVLDGATTRSIAYENLFKGAADGTAGAPAFSFISDPDIGVYRVSSNVLGLAAGGASVLQLDGSTASSATGIKIKSAAAAGGVALSVLSSGADENLSIDAKGAGTITFGGTSTGAFTFNRAATFNVAPTFAGGAIVSNIGASAFVAGANGATNPALQVDASTGSSATGLKIKSAAAAGGVALSVISSNPNDNLSIDAKGSGTITLGGVSTGVINISRPTNITGFTDASTPGAGIVGEVIEATLASGSATALTTGTAKTVISIALTAGDWDLSAIGLFSGGATTTVTDIVASISTATNTLDSTVGQRVEQWYNGGTVLNAITPTLVMGGVRFNVNTPTTAFLTVRSNFGTSTCSAYGKIRARRMN